MKNIILWLIGCLLLSLCGCGGASVHSSGTAATTVIVNTTAAPTTITTAPFPPVGYVNATTLNIRATPGTDQDSVGGLKFGDAVTIVGKEGDWYKIVFGGGFAYVNAGYITDTPPVSTAAATTSTTKSAT